MKIAVIGAGKMGLPLACQFAHRGASVTAIDAKAKVVEAILAGRMVFDEPGVGTLLSEARAAGLLDATQSIELGIRGCEVVVVIIPVLLTTDRRADLSIIEAVSLQIAHALEPGMMVCYETTLPLGTTGKLIKPWLESTGKRAGEDFDLVFSPERVKSRLVLDHLTSTPKIVGGVNLRSSARGAEFYARYLGAPVINLHTLEAAELAKLAGMVYRDVNIALANEMAAYAEACGVDFEPVRQAANTDGEAHLLSPGIGVGGHCAPVYPYFVLQDAAERGISLALTAQGRAFNDAQAGRMLQALEEAGFPPNGERLLILGLGFRPQVKEHTNSTASLIAGAARNRGCAVLLNDPLYSGDEIRSLGFEPQDLNAPGLPSIVVLQAAHDAYRKPDFASWRRRGVRAIIDGRNLWNAEIVCAAGILYVAPGVRPRIPLPSEKPPGR